MIVTVGVLIALAIDQWNDDRLERAEEISAMGRLISDVEGDLQGLHDGRAILARKLASLERVATALESGDVEPEARASFLADVAYGSSYGWFQHLAARTTFNELLGSGKFGLVENAELRSRISAYYLLRETEAGRIDERETDYPAITYELLPRAGPSDENSVDRRMSARELQTLVERVLASPLRDQIVAEMNFGSFAAERFEVMTGEAEALLEALETYIDAIR